MALRECCSAISNITLSTCDAIIIVRIVDWVDMHHYHKHLLPQHTSYSKIDNFVVAFGI